MREKEAFISELENVINDDLYKPLLPKALAVLLKVEGAEAETFEQALSDMENRGVIVYTGKGKCAPPEMLGFRTGIFQKNAKGFGFVLNEKPDERDIFIHRNNINSAMNKDLVAVEITNKPRDGVRPEGKIIKVIKRKTTRVICCFQKKQKFGFAVPVDEKSEDIFISKEDNMGANDGDRVVVEITQWKSTNKSPEGKVIEILGSKGDRGLNVLMLLREQGFIEGFSDEVLEEIKSIPDEIDENIAGRRDLREHTIFTIDGADTKDIDDAISIEKIDGIFRLGVHIADVSHYVKEGSELDKSAYVKATSVYPVDRVSPMLPPKLSNGICSLNPKVDRFALSVTMDIDKNGNIVGHDIFKSVIHSCEQMTYTNVYKILEENDEELRERYKHIFQSLINMKELALILRKKRFDRGAIDFDMPEAKIILDDKDRPTAVVKREITIANIMIEEMMLACNETVAEHFYWMEIPFVYRIHEEPDEGKMQQFSDFIRVMGYKFKGTQEVHSRELQELLKKVKGKKEERVISTIMLRAMQKAKYTNNHSGHFGLGAQYYSHFTSPIRRYPDLMIHRIISQSLAGELTEEKLSHYQTILGEVTGHCSERERAADTVEKESNKLKMAEYMIKHLGEEFPCIISGVTGFGIFVETENLIEGLIPIESLYDDYYDYDNTKYALIGERGKRVFQIGDSIMAQVVRASTDSRTIEFAVDLEYN